MSIKESIDYQSEINFKYFIFLAFKKEISWDNLAIILDGLTTTLQRSKELNKILLEELKLSEEREETKSRQSNEKIFNESDENKLEPERHNTNLFEQENNDEAEIDEIENEEIFAKLQTFPKNHKDDSFENDASSRDNLEEYENGGCEVKSDIRQSIDRNDLG